MLTSSYSSFQLFPPLFREHKFFWLLKPCFIQSATVTGVRFPISAPFVLDTTVQGNVYHDIMLYLDFDFLGGSAHRSLSNIPWIHYWIGYRAFTAVCLRMSHAWWIRRQIVFPLVNASPKCPWLFYMHWSLISLALTHLWQVCTLSGQILPLIPGVTQGICLLSDPLPAMHLGQTPTIYKSRLGHVRFTGFDIMDSCWCFRCRLYAGSPIFVRYGISQLPYPDSLPFGPSAPPCFACYCLRRLNNDLLAFTMTSFPSS